MCVNTLGVFCPSCPVTTVCCVTAHACNTLLPPLVHLAGCLLWCGLSLHPLVKMVPVVSPWCASLWSLATVLLSFSSNMVPPLGASYDLQKVRAAHAGATPMWLHPGRSDAKGEADSWHFSVQAERAEAPSMTLNVPGLNGTRTPSLGSAAARVNMTNLLTLCVSASDSSLPTARWLISSQSLWLKTFSTASARFF